MNTTTITGTVKEAAELRIRAARIIVGQDIAFLEIPIMAFKPTASVFIDAPVLEITPKCELVYNPDTVVETKVEDLATLMLTEFGKILPDKNMGYYISSAERTAPQTERILLDPDAWRIPARADEAYYAANAVNDAVIADMTEERWQTMGAVIARLAAVHPDAAVVVGRRWMAVRPGKKVNPNADALMALIPILKEANIIYTA